MPWLEKRGGKYRIKFRFGGKVRQVPLKTGDEDAARASLAKFEETLGDVLRGRLELPDGADVGLFLLSDGKLDKKPVPVAAPPAVTVEGLFDLYRTQLTPGSKEANTRKCEGVHMRHLARLLGGRTPVAELSPAAVQSYVDRRAAEKYHGKPSSRRPSGRRSRPSSPSGTGRTAAGTRAGRARRRGSRSRRGARSRSSAPTSRSR